MGLVSVKKIIPNYTTCEESDPKYFTQFNIDRNVIFPCKYMDFDRMEISKADLKIDSVKIVETIDGISIEGQNLTGKKLIIIGKIKTTHYFNCIKSNENSCSFKNICALSDCIPFSNFIIVPNTLSEKDPINLKYLIENMSTIKICENKMFISLTILIQYNDEY